MNSYVDWVFMLVDIVAFVEHFFLWKHKSSHYFEATLLHAYLTFSRQTSKFHWCPEISMELYNEDTGKLVFHNSFLNSKYLHCKLCRQEPVNIQFMIRIIWNFLRFSALGRKFSSTFQTAYRLYDFYHLVERRRIYCYSSLSLERKWTKSRVSGARPLDVGYKSSCNQAKCNSKSKKKLD